MQANIVVSNIMTVLYSLIQNIVFKNPGYLLDKDTYLGKSVNVRKRPFTSTPKGSQNDLDEIDSIIKKPRMMKELKNKKLRTLKLELNCAASAELTIDEERPQER